MPDPIHYDFKERMAFSDGHVAVATVEEVCLTNIPGAETIERSTAKSDRNGVDWWVYRRGANALAIDAKVRDEDWSVKPLPYRADDLALETWSVVEAQVVGWTRNENKSTDYILWLWKDTGRWCLVSFPMLCSVMQDNWEAWRQAYKHRQQFTPTNNGGYHSECVFVPRREIWKAIYEKFSGIPKQ